MVSAAVVIAAAGPASGADPAAGRISRDQPALDWLGAASGLGFVEANYVLALAKQPIVCLHEFVCDTFRLDVAESGPLVIESSSCADFWTQLEVETPGGRRLFANGAEQSPRTILEIPGAAPGTYVVRTLVNTSPGSPSGYVGHAKLDFEEPTVAPSPAPAQPASKRAADRLMISAQPLLESRAHRGARIPVRVRSTAPLRAIRVRVSSGRATVAKAKRAQILRTATLKPRLTRTLSPGRYRISVTAKNGSRRVMARALLRVRRASAAQPRRAPLGC